MKNLFGCGIVIGIVIALILCGVVYFFFYSQQDPEGAERQIETVESGWERIKSGGDKSLDFVRSTVPGAGKTKPENSAEELPGENNPPAVPNE